MRSIHVALAGALVAAVAAACTGGSDRAGSTPKRHEPSSTTTTTAPLDLAALDGLLNEPINPDSNVWQQLGIRSLQAMDILRTDLQQHFPSSYGGIYLAPGLTHGLYTYVVLTVGRSPKLRDFADAQHDITKARLGIAQNIAYKTVNHSWRSLQDLADRFVHDRERWEARGVTVTGSGVDVNVNVASFSVREAISPAMIRRIKRYYGSDAIHIKQMDFGNRTSGVTPNPPTAN